MTWPGGPLDDRASAGRFHRATDCHADPQSPGWPVARERRRRGGDRRGGGTSEVLRTTLRVEDPPPFTRAGATIHFRSWVAATENLLVIELSVDGDPAAADPFSPTDLVGVDVTLWPMTGNEAETATGNLPDGYWAVRRFVSTTNSIALEQKPSRWSREAAVALRLFDHRRPGLPWSRGDGWPADRFVLSPARPILLVSRGGKSDVPGTEN